MDDAERLHRMRQAVMTMTITTALMSIWFPAYKFDKERARRLAFSATKAMQREYFTPMEIVRFRLGDPPTVSDIGPIFGTTNIIGYIFSAS